MSDRRVTLELAAFLDSAAWRRLVGIPRDEGKRFAEAFLLACREDLGRQPEELDGEHVRELLLHRLPARLRPKDPLAARADDLFGALLEHLRETHVLANSFELANALETHLAGFRSAVESGEGVPAAPAAPQDPFVHGAAKTGRNDPCFCGSGKKFKKCHGK